MARIDNLAALGAADPGQTTTFTVELTLDEYIELQLAVDTRISLADQTVERAVDNPKARDYWSRSARLLRDLKGKL
jgi:hypothetical protein